MWVIIFTWWYTELDVSAKSKKAENLKEGGLEQGSYWLLINLHLWRFLLQCIHADT